MNSHRSAVIAGVDLTCGTCCVALVAERLALVGRDLHDALAIEHLRQGEIGNRYVRRRTPVKKRNRRSADFLLRARRRLSLSRLSKRDAFAVNTVAREAWYDSLSRKLGLLQLPRASGTDRSDKISDRSLKMHPVTTEAIVHQ